MRLHSFWIVFGLMICAGAAGEFEPARQQFLQESASRFNGISGAPTGRVQLVECTVPGGCCVFADGQWREFREAGWRLMKGLSQSRTEAFVFPGNGGARLEVPVPWREVRQILRHGATHFIATSRICVMVPPAGSPHSHSLPEGVSLRQMAMSPEGKLHVATSGGLWRLEDSRWERLVALDNVGRDWAAGEVLGAAFDSNGQLWCATRAGAGCRTAVGWRFWEGKDGLPWNDFTGIAPSLNGVVWFTTHLGVIRFDGRTWYYRQGPRWLPDDDVAQAVVDADGNAWFATGAGVGRIEFQPMTLAVKAELFEMEIERYIKRTPFGFVAEAGLRRAADKTSADPQDSDNDGLWTAMYGAGECFAYAATRDLKAKARAAQAFAALRFLQKVTQNCSNEPPRGFVARTIRPVDWPDPNLGRLERDREEHRRDALWKVYEPRWPKSADGKWYWKSDTSSDELDGHYFFYPLYYDFCADSDAERERVREVVRDLTDHLLSHDFKLIDHDGKPTRWGIFDPEHLNRDPRWWPERGLNSLSLLAYLAVASHVTGDSKYAAASRELIERHGYAQNAMYPKAQQGPGSGNQSDDEMTFMDFYGLLRCSEDDQLQRSIRLSFFRYWMNEVPEMNPFFNFAYAGSMRNATSGSEGIPSPAQSAPGWLDDSMATLYGFSLDRLNWPHRNRHRLDVVMLSLVASQDLGEPDRQGERGYLITGKVLPVENRHFNHWNTDPWQLDYGGSGNELAAGTVFLLPYYLGLYHGYIQKPGS